MFLYSFLFWEVIRFYKATVLVVKRKGAGVKPKDWLHAPPALFQLNKLGIWTAPSPQHCSH